MMQEKLERTATQPRHTHHRRLVFPLDDVPSLGIWGRESGIRTTTTNHILPHTLLAHQNVLNLMSTTEQQTIYTSLHLVSPPECLNLMNTTEYFYSSVENTSIRTLHNSTLILILWLLIMHLCQSMILEYIKNRNVRSKCLWDEN